MTLKGYSDVLHVECGSKAAVLLTSLHWPITISKILLRYREQQQQPLSQQPTHWKCQLLTSFGLCDHYFCFLFGEGASWWWWLSVTCLTIWKNLVNVHLELLVIIDFQFPLPVSLSIIWYQMSLKLIMMGQKKSPNFFILPQWHKMGFLATLYLSV